MNTENSKIFGPQRPLLNLSYKIDLQRSDKYVALSKFTFTIYGKIQTKSCKDNEFKISAPTWNNEFQD